MKVLPSTVQTIRLKHGIFQVRSQSHPRRIAGYLTVPQIAKVIDKKAQQKAKPVCLDLSFNQHRSYQSEKRHQNRVVFVSRFSRDVVDVSTVEKR